MPNLPSIPDIAKQVDLNKTDILSMVNEISDTETGWFKDKKTGFIIQWGVRKTDDSATIMFPVSFSRGNSYNVLTSVRKNSVSTILHSAEPINATSFLLSRNDVIWITWVAIGR